MATIDSEELVLVFFSFKISFFFNSEWNGESLNKKTKRKKKGKTLHPPVIMSLITSCILSL